MRRLALIAFAAFIFAGSAVLFSAKAYFVLPSVKPAGFVSDFAGVLSPNEISLLENKISALDKSTIAEIAIVTIKSLGGDTIEKAARIIFDSWGIGKAKKDNGVLILVALDERQVRIEPGYGLEGDITDSQSGWIIRNIMSPALSQGKYFDGINGAVDKIIPAITGGSPIPEDSGSNTKKNDPKSTITILVFALFQMIAIGIRPTKFRWVGGGLLAVAYGFLWWLMSASIAMAIGTALISSLFFLFVKAGRGAGLFGGGSGGGGFGGGGGGGFGGFGGGRSGGGGASGGF